MTAAAPHECLVIGGGLAGSMAALRLARAGRQVLLVERESAAHPKVCGEFLSPEAVAYLRRAGVDPLALGAQSIHCLRVLAGARSFSADLPFTALSLSRSVLDEALLAQAQQAGAELRRGAAVSHLARGAQGWIATISGGDALAAPTVFLATGKHDLRGWPRPAGAQNDLVGFKMHWRLPAAEVRALRGEMVLFLFRGGYGGLALVEGDLANLCFVLRRSAMRRRSGGSEVLARLLETVAPLRQYLGPAQPLWQRPLAISPIPYGLLAPPARDGLWRIGDQAAVIPSFTGDGMSIALHSAALAAELYAAGSSPSACQQLLRRQLHSAMRLATLLSRLMISGVGVASAPPALAACPPLLRWIAKGTRIPASALPEWAPV
jgi:flavin-dependent dehydrogenase